MSTLQKAGIGLLVGGALSGLTTACEAWRCGYGGPGCSDPVVAGICSDQIAVGQDHLVLFGYGQDTGVSEATVLSVSSSDPGILEAALMPGAPDLPEGLISRFNLNDGPGDGGILLHPIAPGAVQLTVELEGWDTPAVLELQVVEAAPGEVPVSLLERLQTCVSGGD